MNLDAIVQHVQANLAVYGVAVAVVVPVIFIFRKYTIPFLYHTAEYVIYFGVFHMLFAGLTRAFSWFRVETAFKNYDGSISKDFHPYTTPVNLDFWKIDQYSPHWLFWFEVSVAAMLLYVVIVVRPTRFNKRNNKRHARQKAAKAVKPQGGRYGSRPGHGAGMGRARSSR